MPEPLAIPVADSHCHVDIGYDDHWLEVDEAQQMALDAGVDRIVQIGVDVPSSEWSVNAANSYPRMLATVALHPNEAPRIVVAPRTTRTRRYRTLTGKEG